MNRPEICGREITPERSILASFQRCTAGTSISYGSRGFCHCVPAFCTSSQLGRVQAVSNAIDACRFCEPLNVGQHRIERVDTHAALCQIRRDHSNRCPDLDHHLAWRAAHERPLGSAWNCCAQRVHLSGRGVRAGNREKPVEDASTDDLIQLGIIQTKQESPGVADRRVILGLHVDI